jgi:hypothetical protein
MRFCDQCDQLLVARCRCDVEDMYLTGYIAPSDDSEEIEADPIEGQDNLALSPAGAGAGGAAGDDEAPEPPSTRRRFLPSSIGLTAILPVETREIEVELTWGDYQAEPPLPPEVLEGDDTTKRAVEWVRKPRNTRFVVAVPASGNVARHVVPDSAPAGVPGGGALEIAIQCRRMTIVPPGDAPVEQQVISVFVTNKRRWVARRYGDLTFAFQVELALHSKTGFCPQLDLSRYRASDPDDRLADLHYRDVAAYAVGRNAAACFDHDDDRTVRCVRTTALPRAAVERVEPSKVGSVEFDMRVLAELAGDGGAVLAARLRPLISAYADWSAGQDAYKSSDQSIARAPRRVEVAGQLIEAQAAARKRIAAGIDLLESDPRAARAFSIMNRAMEMAARQRNAAAKGVAPSAVEAPAWRPFQLAFILLNLAGLADKRHSDREIVDLLFFPTGGGKTEAYLGLAAFVIAWRRLSAPGLTGRGTSTPVPNAPSRCGSRRRAPPAIRAMSASSAAVVGTSHLKMRRLKVASGSAGAKRSHSSIGLIPDAQVELVTVELLAHNRHVLEMAPVHADKVDRAIARNIDASAQCVIQERPEFGIAHFPRRHCKLAVAAFHIGMAVDAHVIGRIQERTVHVAVVADHATQKSTIAAITAADAMAAQLPDVAYPGPGLSPNGRDKLVIRVSRGDQHDVYFADGKAGDADIYLAVEQSNFTHLDAKQVRIPTGVKRDLVVSNAQCPGLGLGQVVEDNDRDIGYLQFSSG